MASVPLQGSGAFSARAFDYYPRLQRVRQHLTEHISEPFTATTAARIAGLNANYFSSFFREKVGVRFTEWVRHVRIEHAKVLLSRDDRAIPGVACAAGFGGRRTFERAFRLQTSLTPAEYRRRARRASARPAIASTSGVPTAREDDRHTSRPI